jgi:hypothetical protein
VQTGNSTHRLGGILVLVMLNIGEIKAEVRL